MADDAFDLIQDAFEAIALRGRNGILISDLWPLFPMTADPTQGGFSADAVAGARAFALRQLGDHPEVRFEQHAGSSCTLSAADLASLPPDAPVTAVASDSAITWALGVDAGTLAGLVGLPEVGGTQALPQPASSAGKRLMSALNAIASSGRNGALQSELSKRVGCGPNYLFYQLKMLEACGAVHRAPVVVPMNGSRIVSNDERVIHTAVYRLWRLQPDPPPPGPLCALHSRVSEVQALLAAAPDGILPVSEVRNHFNMRSKKHYTAWTRLKKQVYLANVARPVDVECGKGRVHCLQLLSRAEVAEEGLAQTLDVTPAEQIRAAILQGDGETIAALRRSLQLRHKHVTSITEMLSTNYGFERRRELSGRTLSWRFFPPAAPAAAPEDSDTELDEPKKAGKDGFNFYAVHRRTRIVELLQAEHAAPVAVLRSLLQQVEHRESDSGQMARVDEKSLLRHLMVLQAEGQVELREVPWPGKGAGGDGMALSGPCMVTMVQVPGLDAGVLARIMRNLAQAKSLVSYLKVHVRSSVTKKKMPLITRAQLELTLAGNDEDMAERMARLRAEELSMGYIPARAPRAKLLHQMLLRGMCDGAPWLSWFGVLEQMRITDALVLFGIGQSTLSEALLGMAALARQTGQPSPLEAPAASLPPTLRQELLHSRLASARQNELLKILSTLGLLTKQKDELHVAMRAEMPEGAGAPAVVLRLDNEQSVSELWDRLCAAATSATHTEAAVPSIHSGAKHAAPPSDVPAANGGSIPPDLLRATQWTVERALTNWQRKRLREEEPSPIPSATPAQLEALAATVPVHPTQLEQHWAASAERLKDKLKASEAIQARAAAEARAEEARAAAVVAMTRGAGLDEPTARRPRLLVVQARQLDEADFEAEAVQAVPMEWEAAAPVKWTEASRAQLVDAYAEQIEAMLRSGGGAGSAASPSISQAVTAASHLVDWTAVGVRLGVPPHRCSCALPRLLCAPQDATRRLALRQNLLNRLHAAPVSAEAAGGAAADVVSALGIQLDVSGDVLLPRLREATRMETPREAALRLRLLILLGMDDRDTSPAISTEMLVSFTEAEVEAVQTRLRTEGWASLRNKNKGPAGALVYKLSNSFSHATKGANASGDGRPFIAHEREVLAAGGDPSPIDVPLDLSVGGAAALLEQVAAGQLRLSHTTLRPLAEVEAAAEESHTARPPTPEERRKCASVRLHLIKDMEVKGARLPRLLSETAHYLPRFRAEAHWTPAARAPAQTEATAAPRFHRRLDEPARASALEQVVAEAGPAAREALGLLVRAGETGLTRDALVTDLGGDGAAVSALESASLAVEVEMTLGGEATTRLVAQECADIWLHTPYTLQPPPDGTEAKDLTGSGLTPVFLRDECFVPTWRRHADGSVHTEHVASLRRAVVEWVAARPAISRAGLAAQVPALPPHEVVAAAESLVTDHTLHAVDVPNDLPNAPPGTRRLYFAGPHLFTCE